jgi:hypothetical protein
MKNLKENLEENKNTSDVSDYILSNIYHPGQ